MESNKDYFAFISYKSEDAEWATWLQHELEHYHLPASFNGRTDVPQELRPVFRDIDELSAGNLPEQIKQALTSSQNLIVICSPQAAESPWVNQEVETFISLGRTDRIFPFIVEGNSPSEFFPPALRDLPKEEERLGGDISKKGRDAAFVKVVAGMLGVGFDSLWNRYEKEKAEEERKQREQRDRLLISQSRFLAEKAIALTRQGNFRLACLLAIEALPEDLEHPNRPYTKEAEIALRKATENDVFVAEGKDGYFFNNARNIIYASDAAIKICDSLNGDIIHCWPGNDEGTGDILLSNNCKLLAAISYRDSYNGSVGVNIWNLEESRCIKSLYFDTLICNVHFSPNNEFIVLMSEKRLIDRFDLVIWNIKNDSQMKIGFSESFTYTISHDSSKILVISPDTITLWDMRTAKIIRNFGKQDVIRAFYSPFGGYLAIERTNHTVCIYDIVSSRPIRTFLGHSKALTSLCFSKNNKYIVTASHDKTVKIWNIENGESEKDFVFDDVVYSVTFSPDGKKILYEKSSQVFDSAPIESKVKEIRLQNIIPQSEPIVLNKIEIDDSVHYADFSPNDQLAVSSYANGYIAIWNTNNRKCIRSINAHGSHHVNTVKFNHSGDYVITSSSDGLIRIWRVKDGECLITIKGHNESVTSAFFDFNDEKIISTSTDSTIRIWNKYGECKNVLTKDDFYITIAAISPDGTIIASNASEGDDNYILIWDVNSGEIVKCLAGHKGEITSLSFSSKGDYLVSGSGLNDYTIRIWDIKNGNCLKVLTGHCDIVCSVEFSHDDSLILSASWDNTIKIWENDRVQTLYGHSDGVNSAFFSSDDKKIISASDDKTVRIWSYQPLQELIHYTRRKFHPLTQIEKINYYLE